jgi:IS1 family transposase
LIDYGQLIKMREHGRVVRKEKRVVYGRPSLGAVEMADVENFSSILRERLGRLVGKSKCFSKVKRRLVCSVELFRFYWNFINEFKRGSSPAKFEGLTDRLWS